MSSAYRRFLTLIFCLAALGGYSLKAQVYVGGIQTSIGSAHSPWEGPVGVAADTSGNIYVAQYNGYWIERIDARTHETTTFLTSACGVGIVHPQGLATDSSNNLYIADQGNNRVVKYNLTSNTCTASYTVSAPFAMTADASNNLWVTTDGSGAKVSKIPAGAASGTTPTVVIASGALRSAVGIAFDASGNLYVADHGTTMTSDDGAIYKYTSPNSGSPTRSTFLSYSQGGLVYPYGIMFDSNGNLYVCDSARNEVLKFLASSSYGTSIQVSPNITGAEGVNEDSSGNVFLTAFGSSAVTEISPMSGDFGQVNVGSSKTLQLNFEVVSGTTIGSFQALDRGNTSLEFSQSVNTCQTGIEYGTSTSCSINVTFTPTASGTQLGAVEALSSASSVLATAYVSGTGMAPMIGFSPSPSNVLSISGLTTALSGPRRPAIDSQGNLYVLDFNNNRVVKITSGGVASVVPTGSTLSGANAVAVDGAGNLYINNITTIVEVSPSGTLTTLDNTGLPGFSAVGVAVDKAGNVYSDDVNNNRILEWPNGGLPTVVPISGVTLNNPRDVAIDGSGNLFIADENNNRVIKVTSGVGSVVNTGSLTLKSPAAIAVDAPGNIYVSDSGNDRVVRILANGGDASVINIGSTVTLNAPLGAAVDQSGNVFIIDANNNRVVEVQQNTPETLGFGVAEVGSLSFDSPKSSTLLNLGNASLSITPSVQTTSSTTAAFSLDGSTNTCGSQPGAATSLAANTDCVYGVNFTPSSVGSNIGSLTLTDNSLNATSATQTIALTGTGEQITITPASLTSGSVGSAYSQPLSASGGTGSYTYSIVTGSLPTGLTLSSGGLISGTPTAAGTATFSVQATDSSAAPGPFAGTVNYSLTITAGAPTVTLQTPAAITYGTALSATQYNTAATINGTPVAGSYTYSPALGTVLDAGSHTISVTFTPTDTNDYTTVTASATLVVNKVTPTVTWATPAAINYGTALSTTQLNASAASNGNPVAGTYVYSPAAGTVLHAGSQTLSVTFTATDTGNYNTATATTVLVVNKATPTVTWATPATINYGTALSATQLNASAASNGSSVAGTYTYSPAAGAVLNAGSQTLSVTFAPSDTTDYNTANATTTLAVNKAAGTLSVSSQVISLTAGQSGSIPVNFGTTASGATTPTGSISYTIAGPTTTGGSVTITGSSASVPISSTLTPGTYTVTISYAGDSNYSASTVSVQVTVSQIQPTITWNPPSSITYGSTLASVTTAQAMNGSASVAGTYSYSTGTAVSSATVLMAGSYTVTVTFTPTDTVTYKTATASRSLTVNKASVSIALTSSTGAAFLQNAITLRASVTSSASTPTGTVTFLDGATPLGSASLNGGVATLTVASLSAGSHTITASYSGDNNFLAGTSSALTELLQDFTLVVSSAASETIAPGGTVSYTFNLSPTQSSTFPAAVALAVSGLPTGATYTLTPQSEAAGSSAAAVQLTVTVPQATAKLESNGKPVIFAALGFLLIPFSRRMRRKMHGLGGVAAMLLLLIGTLGSTVALTGCGTSNGFLGQAEKSYTITVTGTSGSLTHSATVQTTVE